MTEKFDIIKIRRGICAIAVVMFLLICRFSDISSAATNRPDSPYLYKARDALPSSYPEKTDENDLLPLRIPETDQAPCFQSVHISNEAGPAGGICFTGTVTDDVRLKKIKVIVKTNAGYGFEVINTPVSGRHIDLSRFCIENIDELLSFKQGVYEVILIVKDSLNQVVSKRFFISIPSRTGCRQDAYGGQCVNYVRNYFGGRHDLMPGLCMYADCGAYHAWKEWDLGYGKGKLPAKKSILILNKNPLLFGHMAVVLDQQQNADGTYTLTVNESNWDRDELIDCNVHYTYFPETSKAVREGRNRIYNVAGFIYSDNVYFQKNILPEHENTARPNPATSPGKACLTEN